MAKPGFLVIGAQKAGTTWLHENLRRHPEVWLPPIKEIHYFDRNHKPLIWDVFRNKYARHMLWRWLKPGFQNVIAHPSNALWHANFFLKRRSDQWYEKCFYAPSGKITGDITPAYARLDDNQIEKVADLLPAVKVIYILRDPIERMWSQAAMYFSRYGHSGLENQTNAQIKKFLSWKLAQSNSDYLANISRWQKHFPSESFRIVFFDQLQADPAEFLAGICDFLNIETLRNCSLLNTKIHSRDYPEMPVEIHAELRREFLEPIKQLDLYFQNEDTARWLRRYQEK